MRSLEYRRKKAATVNLLRREINPFWGSYLIIDGKRTPYICRRKDEEEKRYSMLNAPFLMWYYDFFPEEIKELDGFKKYVWYKDPKQIIPKDGICIRHWYEGCEIHLGGGNFSGGAWEIAEYMGYCLYGLGNYRYKLVAIEDKQLPLSKIEEIYGKIIYE